MNNIVTPINVRRACYAMTNADGNEAEISMYGDIVESQPINYWTGEPVEGSFIIQDEFLKDLNLSLIHIDVYKRQGMRPAHARIQRQGCCVRTKDRICRRHRNSR